MLNMASILKFFVVFVAFCSFLTKVDSDTPGDWCYDNPGCDENSTEWKKGVCQNGNRQSPIVLPKNLKPDNDKFRCPVDFGMTDENAYNLNGYTLTNKIKTIEVSIKTSKASFRWPEKKDGTYALSQIHFHWGPDDKTGSEHTIERKAYSMEMHLVHYRSGGPKSYKNLDEAVKSGQTEALAVIGFFFEGDTTLINKTTMLTPIAKNLDRILEKNKQTVVNGATNVFKLGELIKAQTLAFHYEGSLTTPGCNEIVQWLVCQNPVKVSPDEITKFREATKQASTFRKAKSPDPSRIIQLVPFWF